MSSLLNGLRWISGSFTGTLNWTPTVNRTITLPNTSGVVLLDTTAAIAGSVVNPVGVSIVDWIIPAGVRRLTLLSSGIDAPAGGTIVRLGSSSGVLAAGYSSVLVYAGFDTGFASNTTGMQVPQCPPTASFCMNFYRGSSNNWNFAGQSMFSTQYITWTSGNIGLPGELTTVRYVALSAINSGSLQLLWEY